MNEPKFYTKRPVTVPAIQWTGNNYLACAEFLKGSVSLDATNPENLRIFTLEDGPNEEAKHYATKGDFIIKGVKGEYYACKPDIFDITYTETVYRFEDPAIDAEIFKEACNKIMDVVNEAFNCHVEEYNMRVDKYHETSNN